MTEVISFTRNQTKKLNTYTDSNHPPSVIQQIPIPIKSSLSTLSFSEKIFHEAVPPY